MVGLPQSLVKKYGISKQAWAAYRSMRGSSKVGGRTMPKKKYASRRAGGRRWFGRKRTYRNTMTRRIAKLGKTSQSLIKTVATVGAAVGPGIVTGMNALSAGAPPVDAVVAGLSPYIGLDMRPGADNSMPAIAGRLAFGYTPTFAVKVVKWVLRAVGV